MHTSLSSSGEPRPDLRLAGNLAFRDGRFDDADSLYTQALGAPVLTAEQHLLLGNRSVLHAAAAIPPAPRLITQQITGTLHAERRYG